MVDLLLKRWLFPLWQSWWLIILSALLAGVSAHRLIETRPPMYRTHLTLIISPHAMAAQNPTSETLRVASLLTRTYSDLAQRQLIQQRIKTTLDLAYTPDITVTHNNNNLIDVVVVDSNAKRAQAIANELARQLQTFLPQTAVEPTHEHDFVQQLLNGKAQQITTLQTELITMQAQLHEAVNEQPTGTSLLSLQQLVGELQAAQTQHTILLANTRNGASNLIVVESLTTTAIVTGNKQIILLTAVLGATALAILAAYLWAYLDDTIQTSTDLTTLIQSPLLAQIGHVKSVKKLVTHHEPRAPISEALRDLRTVYRQLSDGTHRTLLITSPTQREGKSFIAANLAVVMAQQGFKVLLIDADLRKPSQHHTFQLSNDVGLTSLLKQDVTNLAPIMPTTIQNSFVRNLSILPSGPPLNCPPNDILTTTMPHILSTLQTQFDILILDSPAILAAADAMILSHLTDDVMVVLRSGQHQPVHLQATAKQLQLAKAHAVGYILNKVPQHQGLYSYDYGQYQLSNLQGSI